jgi:catechol 2,3-dioxygenase-like lactoylglutathione lyase family enzyme
MIRGIGGIFIYSEDAKALVAWYTQHLGIRFDFEPEEGSYYRDFVLPIDPAYGRDEREVFAIRQGEAIPPGKRFVINLRVTDLAKLLGSLKESGVEIDRAQDYVYGRFAWLKDADGNELELFEPA